MSQFNCTDINVRFHPEMDMVGEQVSPRHNYHHRSQYCLYLALPLNIKKAGLKRLVIKVKPGSTVLY